MRAILAFAARVGSAIRAKRTAWMALGALAFGAMAVLGARHYIGERLALEKARLQPRHEMLEVVVARRDLRRGDTVGPDTMAVRRLPREYAPGGAVVPAGFDAVSGARLLSPMKAGEPLLPSAVASAETSGISSRVKPGVRAMTIAVDEVNSLSGMLQPGDRIDLMLSVRPPSVAGVVSPEVTRTVMQGVPVMATGRQSRASFGDEAAAGRAYTSITVEVDPEQAQKLVVAQRSGKLTAVLRNPDDHKTVGDRRLDVNMLLGLPLQQAAAPVRAGPEIIVGGQGSLPPSSGGAVAGVPRADAAGRPLSDPGEGGAREGAGGAPNAERIARPRAGAPDRAAGTQAGGSGAAPAAIGAVPLPGGGPSLFEAPASIPLYR
jgi:pilus assembly protein CpaB